MKRLCYVKIMFLILSFLILVISCPGVNPGETDTNPPTMGPTYPPAPPPSPTPLIEVIKNLSTTVLETTGGINVSWNSIRNTDEYTVYRYTSPLSDDPVIFSSDRNEFFDTTAGSGKPYYYKVSYFNNGAEYGTSELKLGLYHSETDIFEKNNLLIEIEEVPASIPIIGQKSKALLYSCYDSSGKRETDVDWYKYYGEAKGIFVDVALSDTTEFNTGDIKFAFYFNGTYEAEQIVNTGVNNEFAFDNYRGSTGKVTVYFKVYVEEHLKYNDRASTFVEEHLNYYNRASTNVEEHLNYYNRASTNVEEGTENSSSIIEKYSITLRDSF
ncbi:MAG: hypothetical protein JXJ04_25240 [Spirochaetales bacterium]|nr:hypothetical protein [Spirochaetales bacterium]